MSACPKSNIVRDRAQAHGHAKRGSVTPTYRTWVAMRARCLNPNVINYANYGGRGIKVCERWDDFENFLADMGLKPSPKHSIDRIDNDGNYESGNCHWATKLEQARNSRAQKLSESDILRIESLHLDGVSYPEIAKAVCVGRARVGQVLRERFGKQQPLRKLTEENVRTIRACPLVPIVDFARKFGVSRATILRVRSFSLWKHVK